MGRMIKPDFRLRAIIAHGDQMYGEHPYAFHLSYVEMILCDHGFITPTWQAAAWFHDAVEDTALTREEIAVDYSDDVAALVFAVSGFGENRKERNTNIKSKIRDYPDACILKIADRIANVEHAKRGQTRQFGMYHKEYPDFRNIVEAHVPPPMVERLDQLFA